MKRIIIAFVILYCWNADAQDYYKNVYEAESSLRQHRPAEALSYYKKALALREPGRDDAYNIACLYSKMQDSAHAITYLDIALQKGQGNPGWMQMDPDLSYLRLLHNWPLFLERAKKNEERLNDTLLQLRSAENYNWRKHFSPKQLREDISVLRNAMEEAHPGMYWYTGKKVFDAAWKRLVKGMADSLTVTAFYWRLLQTINLTRCAHSETSLPQHVFKQFNDSASFFPVPLKFIGNRAFINAKETGNFPYAFGDELIALNGTPIADIHKTLQPLIVADGFSITGKQRVLNRIFYRLYTMVYEPGDKITMSVKHSAGNITKCEIQSVNKKTQEESYRNACAELNDSLPARFFYMNHVPVLRITTFNSGNFSSMNYFRFLDSVFTLLQTSKSRVLILDIRQNNGGDESFLQELLSYLLDHPVLPYKSATVKTTSYSFLKYTDNFMNEVDARIKTEFQKDKNGKFSRKPDWAQQAVQKKNAFHGMLYVLISGLDVSAGSSFASLLYQNRKHTLFAGEETGGGYYGNNSSYYLSVTLPNTKIRFRLPLVQLRLNTAGMPFGHGLIPQYQVQETLQDLKNGNDAALQKVLRFASKVL